MISERVTRFFGLAVGTMKAGIRARSFIKLFLIGRSGKKAEREMFN